LSAKCEYIERENFREKKTYGKKRIRSLAGGRELLTTNATSTKKELRCASSRNLEKRE